MNDGILSFLKWMGENKISLSPKISINFKPDCNYGVYAVDEISKNEVLFEIPRDILLSIDNSHLSKVISLSELKGSKWSILILCIMHEIYLNDQSKWNNYLKMFPNFKNLEIPLQWNDHDLELLNQTGVNSLVLKDRKLISHDFNEYILPVVQKHPALFGESCTLEKYKQLVGFVMAYSFTETHIVIDEDSDDEESSNSSPPCMVPMADVFNHTSKNNARLVYHADKLVMIAVDNITSGDQVWNTYGDLPNTMLLHMYGFTLDYEENHDDVVEISVSTDSVQDNSVMLRRIALLEVVRPDLLVLVADRNGLMNTIEAAQLLQVLNLGECDFQVWSEQMTSDHNWEEISEELEQMADMMDCGESLKGLPMNWRRTIVQIVNHHLDKKKKALADLPIPHAQQNGFAHASKSEFVQRILQSQICLLENLISYL